MNLRFKNRNSCMVINLDKFISSPRSDLPVNKDFLRKGPYNTQQWIWPKIFGNEGIRIFLFLYYKKISKNSFFQEKTSFF